MKFLRDRSLAQLSIIIAIVLLGTILGEIFWLKTHFNKTESIENQIDFVRTLQLKNQRLSLLIEQSSEERSLKSEIISLTEDQDLNLRILEEGGRVPGTDIFLNPLQRLPKITFDNLILLWKGQKEALLALAPTSKDAAKAKSVNILAWYERLINDLYGEVSKSKKGFSTILLTIILIDTALLVVLILAFVQFIIRPLKFIEQNTQQHQHSRDLQKNEIGSVAIKINEVIEQLRDATDFVKGIGEGKLDMDYKNDLDPEYVEGKNKLADELVAMQGKLKSLNKEEQQRKWANEGLAKFVDILRDTNDNLHTLGDKIISTLAQYTGANQGALYILNDDEEKNNYLELISLFAFNLKKFENQRVKLGEGILGQTFLEKETTYLTNLPEDYVRITSGLGDSNPKSILIVPLKVDKEVYGIVELASFNAFEPFEISFVEKLGETIASTLSSVKINHKNKKLLEQFQEQTENMRSQEEEMRQNMEELTATQEGMHRLVKEAQDKEAYLNNLMDASPDAIVAIDRDYKVVLLNNAPLFEKFLTQGIHYEKGYNVLGLFRNQELEYHKAVYDKAFAGETIVVTKEYFGRQYSISYSPLRSMTGEVIGVSIFAHDETELQQLKAELAEKELNYNEKVNTLEASSHGKSDESWRLAEEMEKTFRLQLEALKITQEEITRNLR